MSDATTLPESAGNADDVHEHNHSVGLNPWVKALLSVLSGLILMLAYPHADIGVFAFVALVPFLKTFPYVRTRSAFGFGFLFGFTYFACLLYWIAVFSATKIGPFGVAAWLILSARESLYVGLFAALTNFLWRRTGWLGRAIGAASLWTICEWLRQLGSLGFGWGDLAYSQWQFLPFIQFASVTGLWGISWLLVFCNVALVSGRTKLVGTAVAVVVMITAVGAVRILDQKHRTNLSNAAALQADVSEDVPYSGLRPADSRYFYGTLDQFGRMAGIAKDKYGATICVTAETSIPGYPNLDPALKSILSEIAIRHQITLILGARDTDFKSQLDTNSVFAFLPDGRSSGPYNKQQLVPFGEYVPLRQYLPVITSFHVLDFEMQPGAADQAPLDAGENRKAGIAVCYESTYPRFLREQVARGATFDVVVTDDTWYGKTAAAQQHFAMSVLRAVETDRYLVRCAATGISGVISPTGRVLASAPIFKKAIVTAPIEQRTDLTPFVRFGDWFPILCIGAVLCILLLKQDTVVDPATTISR
jgi:apolipoprotein N-acyltransferase